MLILQKNKQHKLATMMLSMFVGSWLLLLCQTCFASNDSEQVVDQQMAEMTMPCHESVSIESVSIDSDEKACFSPCDCDELNVTINSDTNHEYKERIKYSQVHYVSFEQKITLSNRAPPVCRIFTPPERAIHLPLQNCNVLLI